jgi:hypothetical protein
VDICHILFCSQTSCERLEWFCNGNILASNSFKFEGNDLPHGICQREPWKSWASQRSVQSQVVPGSLLCPLFCVIPGWYWGDTSVISGWYYGGYLAGIVWRGHDCYVVNLSRLLVNGVDILRMWSDHRASNSNALCDVLEQIFCELELHKLSVTVSQRSCNILRSQTHMEAWRGLQR